MQNSQLIAEMNMALCSYLQKFKKRNLRQIYAVQKNLFTQGFLSHQKFLSVAKYLVLTEGFKHFTSDQLLTYFAPIIRK